MLEQELEYERDIFLWLNNGHNPLLDQFWWLFSGKIVWIPLLLYFIYFLFSNYRPWKQALIIVVAIAIVITLCDQFASSICKPLFSRFRPTHYPGFEEYVHTVFGYKGGRYGFISSHAANAFGFVTFTALLFKQRSYTVIMFIWATLTAYSRIYLGVHFISDIIPGMMVGLLFGFLIYKLYLYVILRYDKNDNGETTQSLNFHILYIILLATIVFMLVISSLYTYDLIPALRIK